MSAFLPTLQIQVKIIEEVVSKLHLVSDSCVADLFVGFIPSSAGLRFFIGLRLLNSIIFIKIDVKSRQRRG
jgi:hypothetical protein